MHDHPARYHALFGPDAPVTQAEREFLEYWTTEQHRALDYGAGLCGPARVLSQLGLDVFAYEPSPIIAAVALDRLNRKTVLGKGVTLLEGSPETLSETVAADFILIRGVFMLLNDEERRMALDAVSRHSVHGARLILDVRTAALPWAEQGGLIDEKRVGHATYTRHISYIRDSDQSTRVTCKVTSTKFGKTTLVAQEEFRVRADSPDHLRDCLAQNGFHIDRMYGAYDLAEPYTEGAHMIVCVAHRAIA
jgi:hypothetical protein